MSTDPTDLAREVLYAEELHDGTPASEADLREERWEFYQDLCTSQAPALARAVIELTAKVERMEALADRLEHEARVLGVSGSGLAVHAGSVKGRVAARIRATLNEETPGD